MLSMLVTRVLLTRSRCQPRVLFMSEQTTLCCLNIVVPLEPFQSFFLKPNAVLHGVIGLGPLVADVEHDITPGGAWPEGVDALVEARGNALPPGHVPHTALAEGGLEASVPLQLGALLRG